MRTLFVIAFVLVWLEGVGCFVCFSILTNSGIARCYTRVLGNCDRSQQCLLRRRRQKQLYDLMLTTMKFAIPGIMLSGFLLHHLVGIKIFESRDQRSRF